MGTKRGARRAGRGLLAAYSLALIAAVALPAAAQTPQTAVGVEISPSRIQKDLSDRDISEQLLVANHEAEPRNIKLSVAGLGHDLDGAPAYFEQGAAPGALSLSETEFTLAPSQSKKVALAGSIPATARSLYAAVLAEFAPLTPQEGQIEVRSRVASLLLYRAPKPWRQTVEIVDAQIIPGDPGGPVRVAAAIKATGDVHVNPTGTATISKDGINLTTVQLSGQLIIPSFARRLSGYWTPPKDLKGIVTIVVRTKNPPAELRKTIDLGGGVAELPQAEIVNLRGSNENGGQIGLTIRNTGSAPVTPVVTLFVRQSGVERARTVLPQGEVKPGATHEVTWKPSLDDGVYLVTAQLKSGEDLLDEDTTDLRIGASAKPGGTSRRSPAIALAALMLAIVIGVLLFMLWRRKRDDNDGDQSTSNPPVRSHTREPVGAAPPR